MNRGPTALIWMIVVLLAICLRAGLAMPDQRWRVLALSQIYAPAELALGADGAVWGPSQSPAGLFRADSTGNVRFVPASFGQPTVIASGSDGRLWTVVDSEHFLAYDPASETQTIYNGLPVQGILQPYNLIVLGGDGNIWYAVGGYLATISPQGRPRVVFDSGPSGSIGSVLSAGPDGRVRFIFAHSPAGPNRLGVIDPKTHIVQSTAFPRIGQNGFYNIAATPDNSTYVSVTTQAGSYFLKFDRSLKLVVRSGPFATYAGNVAIGRNGAVFFSTFSGNALGVFHPASQMITLDFTPNDEDTGALLISRQGSVWAALGSSPGYGQPPALGIFTP